MMSDMYISKCLYRNKKVDLFITHVKDRCVQHTLICKTKYICPLTYTCSILEADLCLNK